MCEYELALADCDEAIRLDPQSYLAVCTRGTAFLGLGSLALAAEEFERAIAPKKDFGLAFNNRAFLHILNSDYPGAIQDLDRAIAAEPTLVPAHLNRAGVAFCQQRFADAVVDCAEAVRLDPKNIDNSRAWLYFAEARTSQDARVNLQKHSANLNLAKWPGPIIAFLLGSITEDQLLEAAKHERPPKQREQFCHPSI